jgi:hypothetical protein
MARFDDYHRTVIGYHGTYLSVAIRLVTRVNEFKLSERDYDWLGKGVYFWEYAPKQALNFAKIRQSQLKKKRNKTFHEQQRATERLAVVACMIRLGFCLDMTEPENVEYVKEIYDSYKDVVGENLPKNNRKYRKLDNAVFEYAYKVIEAAAPKQKVDTSRGVYVPTDGGKRIWDGSWISRDTHIQLCVRNMSSILGTWLHYPDGLEVEDVCKTLQIGSPNIDSDNP